MFFKDKGTPGGQNNKPNMKGKSMATNDVDTVEFNFEIGKNFDRYFPKNNLKNLLEKLELFSSHRRKSSRKKYPKTVNRSSWTPIPPQTNANFGTAVSEPPPNSKK